MNVLVTGANGFVGKALCRTLVASGATVFGAVRSQSKSVELPTGVQPIVLDLDSDSPFDAVVGRFDGVVHLAARVHQMRETADDPLDAYRAINARATEDLARWAVGHGVRRFVFLSSIKVNGEGQDFSEASQTYTELDAVAPQDPYGISKWEAEQGLRRIANETGLETVVLRPTLIYGPEVKANFRQLLRLVKMGLPLPLSRVNNARSLLFLGNLTDAIRVCLSHPRAAGETFLVSDGHDLSTPELIRGLARAMHQSARLFPFAPKWLETLGRLTGKSSAVQRLLGSLQIDSTKIRRTLDWQPPLTVYQGLQATADWYLEQAHQSIRANRESRAA